jgi:hypothetical protein
MMADGHLNKCSACQKENSKENYRKRKEYRKEYESRRSKTKSRKIKVAGYQRIRRKKFPEKDRARRLVTYYVRSGKILKAPCEVCGDKKVEAHHADYKKPLDVQWLCHFHHRQLEGRLV